MSNQQSWCIIPFKFPWPWGEPGSPPGDFTRNALSEQTALVATSAAEGAFTLEFTPRDISVLRNTLELFKTSRVALVNPEKASAGAKRRLAMAVAYLTGFLEARGLIDMAPGFRGLFSPTKRTDLDVMLDELVKNVEDLLGIVIETRGKFGEILKKVGEILKAIGDALIAIGTQLDS